MVDITDIVHKYKGMWYFWDETWSFEHGPYPTEKAAESALHSYCASIIERREKNEISS